MSEKCPKCHSTQIEKQKEFEYTGGGYANYWYEYMCKECKHEWRSEKRTTFY